MHSTDTKHALARDLGIERQIVKGRDSRRARSGAWRLAEFICAICEICGFTSTGAMKSIEVRFATGDVMLEGNLTLPEEANGVVLFAHGSGSSRSSPRNTFVAGVLNGAGLGTLLFDLLTKEEEAIDLRAGRLRFNISLLSQRLLAATDFLLAQSDMRGVRLGYFGASTGGAAALMAAVERPQAVRAIVCRGSRTDMAAGVLAEVAAPTLLIVGEADSQVLTWNRESFAELHGEKRLEVIPGATHLFEEQGKLQEVARLATGWFVQHLKPSAP